MSHAPRPITFRLPCGRCGSVDFLDDHELCGPCRRGMPEEAVAVATTPLPDGPGQRRNNGGSSYA